MVQIGSFEISQGRLLMVVGFALMVVIILRQVFIKNRRDGG